MEAVRASTPRRRRRRPSTVMLNKPFAGDMSRTRIRCPRSRERGNGSQNSAVASLGNRRARRATFNGKAAAVGEMASFEHAARSSSKMGAPVRELAGQGRGADSFRSKKRSGPGTTLDIRSHMTRILAKPFRGNGKCKINDAPRAQRNHMVAVAVTDSGAASAGRRAENFRNQG